MEFGRNKNLRKLFLDVTIIREVEQGRLNTVFRKKQI